MRRKYLLKYAVQTTTAEETFLEINKEFNIPVTPVVAEFIPGVWERKTMVKVYLMDRSVQNAMAENSQPKQEIFLVL